MTADNGRSSLQSVKRDCVIVRVQESAERNPLEQYEGEFRDPSEFLYGALRSMLLAYVPD